MLEETLAQIAGEQSAKIDSMMAEIGLSGMVTNGTLQRDTVTHVDSITYIWQPDENCKITLQHPGLLHAILGRFLPGASIDHVRGQSAAIRIPIPAEALNQSAPKCANILTFPGGQNERL